MRYFIDAGSSSLKIYIWNDGHIRQLEKKSYKLTQKLADCFEIAHLLCREFKKGT